MRMTRCAAVRHGRMPLFLLRQQQQQQQQQPQKPAFLLYRFEADVASLEENATAQDAQLRDLLAGLEALEDTVVGSGGITTVGGHAALLSDLAAQLATVNDTLAEHSMDLSALLDTAGAHEARLNAAEAGAAELNATLRATGTRVDGLEADVAEHAVYIGALLANDTAHTQLLQAHSADMAALALNASAQHQELRALGDAVDGCCARTVDDINDINATSARIETLEDAVREHERNA